MLRLYRNNQIFTSLAVLFYFIPLFLSDVLQQPSETVDLSQAAGWLVRPTLERFSAYRHLVFAVLGLGLAFWVNFFANRYRFHKRPNFMGSITALLCLYAFEQSGLPMAALVANIPLLIAFQNIIRAYERKNSIIEVYNAAFWIAIAALCYSPAVWYALFILVAWFQLRSFNTQEFLILLSGFFTPFLLLGTYLFINDQLIIWWIQDFSAAFGRMQLGFKWIPINIIPISWLVILLLWSLANLANLKQKTTIKEQKYLNVLLTFLCIAAISPLGLKEISLQHWGMMFLPFSLFLSLNLQSLRNERTAALIHWIILVTVLLTQWYAFL